MRFESRLALPTWTLDTTPLAEALRAVKNAGWNGVELRRVDFARCFERGMSNAQVLDFVRGSGLKVGTMGIEYGILFAKGEARRRLFKSLEETCVNAAALGCEMLMTAIGQGEGTAQIDVAGVKGAGDVEKEQGWR